jgi:hypothetical protein
MSLYLTAKTAPVDTEFPGSVQGYIDLLAQYLGIAGDEGILGINFGAATPTSDNRNKPWFKTTTTGTPLGLFSWNGTTWAQMPFAISSGTTAQRPASPNAATLYFDTDINTALIFERGRWRTIAGAPGDLKYVAKTTLAAALTQNPGWKEYEDARGRVLGAAGAGPGLTERAYNDKVGAETVTLTKDDLPAHAHAMNAKPYSGQHANGSQGAGVYPVVTGFGNADTGAIGGDKAHANMQPTLFVWCLIKE